MKLIAFGAKRWKLGVAGMILIPLLAVWFSRGAIARSAEGRVIEDASLLPDCEVALVLGCARVLPDGRRNLYFKHRIAAVKALWESGRVQHVLVSGDNSRKDYDEPGDMKEALIGIGIPSERIHCDFAGFRTLDSVVRARDVFQLERFVIVSQQFHVERALYIAKDLGIEAYGFPARDVGGKAGFKTRVREDFARVKAVLDMKILNTQPKFRGEPVPILSGL